MIKKILILGVNDLAQAISMQYTGPYDVQFYAPAQGYNAHVSPGKDVMNVCIPYDEHFVHEVQTAITEFDIKLTIIHSPVPMGTTEKIQETLDPKYEVAYAPVLFNDKSPVDQTKFIGADTLPAIQSSMAHLSGLGYTMRPFSSSRLIELATDMVESRRGVLETWNKCLIERLEEEGIPPEMFYEIIGESK